MIFLNLIYESYHFAKRSARYIVFALSAFLFLMLVSSFQTGGFISSRKQAVKSIREEIQPRLFLIEVADTDDDSIGERCETDIDMVTEAFRDIADWIDADMKTKIVSGDSYSKAGVNNAIDNWLRNQQPSHSDIVIFYYTGHGFRYPKDASKYPRMWLKTAGDKNLERNNLSIEGDVYNRIIKMGAGLNIVLSDCCNNTIAGDDGNFDNIMVPTRKRQAHKREHPRVDDDNDDDDDYGDKLFIVDHPVSILAAAAGKGELAGGKPDAGGFFTNYFLEALDKCIYDNSLQPSWKQIFSYAGNNAGYWARSAPCPSTNHNEQGRCVQNAVVQVSGAE